MLMENVGGLLSEAMKDITDCASAVWTGMPLVPLSGTQISLSLSLGHELWRVDSFDSQLFGTGLMCMFGLRYGGRESSL